MIKKIIPHILALSLIMGTFVPIQAHQYNQINKKSTIHRLGFFFLHSLCLIGGFKFALNNAKIAEASVVLRNSNPEEVEKVRIEKLNDYIKQHGHHKDADNKTKEMIEYLKKDSTFAIKCMGLIAGTAIGCYGLQGIIKDVFNLFK